VQRWRLQFGDGTAEVEADGTVDQGRWRSAGQDVELPPISVRYLRLLAAHHPDAVPDDVMYEGLWGAFPPASPARALDQVRHAVRSLSGHGAERVVRQRGHGDVFVCPEPVVRVDAPTPEPEPVRAGRWLPEHRRPLPAARFFGRDALLGAIADALQLDTAVVWLRGMTGMGKTLLAETFALRHGQRWPGGVIWFDLPGEPRDPEETLARHVDLLHAVAADVDVPCRDPADPSLRSRLYARLRELGPFLRVIDDVPAGLDAATLRALIGPADLGPVLVTTRSAGYGHVGITLDLGALAPEEALALLEAHCPAEDEDERRAASAIGRALGHHALALDVVGAYLATRSTQRPYTEFQGELADPAADGLGHAASIVERGGPLPTGHPADVEQALAQRLERLSPDARQLLGLAAMLSTAPFTGALLGAALARLQGDTPRDAGRRVDAAFTEIDAASLVIREARAFRLHPLVARVARGSRDAPTGTEPARRALSDSVLDALERAERPGPDLLAHARALIDAGPADNALIEPLAAIELARGRSGPAVALRERRYEHLRDTRGPDDARTLQASHLLAEALVAASAFVSAQAAIDVATGGRVRILGPDHPDALASRLLQARILGLRGSPSAGDAARTVFDALCAQCGSDHPLSLRARLVVGECLRRVDAPDAEAWLASCVAATGAALGPEDPATLRARTQLVFVQELHMIPADAAELEALRAARERMYGPEHPSVSVLQVALAQSALLRDRPEEALALARAAHEQRLRSLGPDDLQTLATNHVVASALRLLGRREEARAVEEREYEASRLTRGDDAHTTLLAMERSAECAYEDRDLSRSAELLGELLVRAAAALGDGNADVARIRHNLGQVQIELGAHDEALANLTAAFAPARSRFGAAHPLVLRIGSTRAWAVAASGDPDAAVDALTELLARCEQTFDERHVVTQRTALRLGLALHLAGRPEEARAPLARALPRLRAVLGSDHPEVAAAEAALGDHNQV
jgi:tetratricopeptide (TPR) repeat protein